MKLKEEDSIRVQEIIKGMQCLKKFSCVVNGFENLCKAKDFGDEKSLQCLEDTSPPCPFVGVYDYGFEMRFCRCALRVYLAKNLGI